MKPKLFFAGLLALAMVAVSACTANSAAPSGGSSAPRAWFDAPLPNTVFRSPNATVAFPPSPCYPIVAHGASPNGIAAFELTVNGAAASIPSPDTKSSLVALRRDYCELSQPGEYLFQLRAQDNAGNWSGYAETSLIVAEGGTPTPTPTPAPAACVDKLDVTSENPLQKTYMLPGQNFTKSWTVQNTGTCTWGKGYRLVFTGGPSLTEGGASMNGPLDTPLGSLVPFPVSPGGKATIPLPQAAPMSEGWYVGAWNLVAPNGSKIPITYGGSDTMPSMYVDIVVKGGTPTPAPLGGVSVERVSTNLVYLGQASCGTQDVTIVARATAPKGIKVVVLFYRFFAGGSTGEFQSVAMNPIGGDLYQRTLNPTSLLGSVPFDQATLQYQIVIQQNDGDVSLRTPVMADIVVQACGPVTAACSSYTDQRTCEAKGCNWVAGPGIVPVYECKAP